MQMIYLKLFLHFLKIGAVSFGGGYGMISLIRETVLDNGWLTENEFLSFIAVSESTPGPLAVNMATFVGASQGGAAGSFFATLGVILPSFIIIFLIASVIGSLLSHNGVKAFLSGVRPCIAALILTAACTMGLNVFFGIKSIDDNITFHYRDIVIFFLLSGIGFLYRTFKKKKISPVYMFLVSAALGILFNLFNLS